MTLIYVVAVATATAAAAASINTVLKKIWVQTWPLKTIPIIYLMVKG